MAAGLPVEEAVAIFNTFSHLPPSDVTTISQAEWRLRRLVKARPGDMVVAVAHLQSLEMLGMAPEAIAEAERLWHLRSSMSADVLAIYLSQLGHLAMYARAGEVFDLINARGVVGWLTNPLGTEFNLAWAVGDAHKASAALRGSPTLALEWDAFISKLKMAGLLPHLPARQKIVQELTFGRQCLTGVVLTVDDEGETDFSHHVYVSAAYDDRMKLEENIQSRLDHYFAGVGIDNGGHWDLITEIVLPVTAAPPNRQEFKNAA